MKLIILAFLVAILLESTIITLPLTLLIIIFSAITIRKNEVFFLAFLAGLLLDVLTFRNIGWSSLFFTMAVFTVFLYQKKFEIDSLSFVLVISLIGSFGYLLTAGISFPLIQSLISAFIFSSSFLIFKKSNKKALKYK